MVAKPNYGFQKRQKELAKKKKKEEKLRRKREKRELAGQDPSEEASPRDESGFPD